MACFRVRELVLGGDFGVEGAVPTLRVLERVVGMSSSGDGWAMWSRMGVSKG